MIFRSLFALLFLVPMVWRSGGVSSLRITSWRNRHFGFLPHHDGDLDCHQRHILPLADVEALLFSTILFTVLLSGPLLGEKVGWHD